jgi:YHS domain-containing protein
MIRFICLAYFLIFASLASAQDAMAARRLDAFNVQKGKPAIQGYDPVDYFVKNKATKGKTDYAYNFGGIIYRFSSAANLAAFKEQPEKYEPQYGGWCAFAMGNDGTKVEVDPATFRIYQGKLYLFYNSFFNNTLKSWLKAEAELKKKADRNWPKYYH